MLLRPGASRRLFSKGVATCERISEALLIPVLEALLQSFPFVILGFHTDNGSGYINFHRPCLFAENRTDAKGRQRKCYPCKLMMTPCEKLKSLPQAQTLLKPGITFAQLDELAGAMSGNAAAERMNEARSS